MKILKLLKKMFRKWYISFWLALAAVLFLGTRCSCNWHLKQAAKKCPSLVVRDTITIRDTIKIAKVQYDTLFTSKPGDTITITKDRLHIKYVKLPGDSVYIQGKCDSIFINRFIKVPYEKAIYNVEKTWWQKTIDGFGITFFCIVIVLIVLGLWRLWKFIN